MVRWEHLYALNMTYSFSQGGDNTARMGSRQITMNNVQMLRGVAACLVVLCHTIFLSGPLPTSVVHFSLACGFSGVALFFVISGFIIAMKAAEGFERKGRIIGATEFAYNRVTRIYPLYWIVLVCALVAALYLTGSPLENAQVTYPRLLLLLDACPPLGAAWTLKYEIYFYTLMTAVMMMGWGNLRRTLWVFVAVYAAVLTVAMYRPSSWFLASPYFLEFVFGVVVFIAIDAGWKLKGWIVSLIGAAGLVYGTYLIMDDPWGHDLLRPFALGVPSMVLVYGMICFEKTWRAPKFAVAIGDASYSIYLWHFAIMHQIYILNPPIYRSPFITLATIVLMVAIGLVSYRHLEAPIGSLASRLRHIVFTSPAVAVPSAL